MTAILLSAMPEAIEIPAMGLAIRLCVQLQQQARRHNAMPELSVEENFAIRLLFKDLGQCLADGEDAVVAPRLPFHLGGTFCAANLEILVDPDPTDLSVKHNAPRPAFLPGAMVSLSTNGEALTHKVVAMDWDLEEDEWLYQLGEGHDAIGNMVTLGAYASRHQLQPA